jgi:uncharacterized protein YjgD (DUF1641 family)
MKIYKLLFLLFIILNLYVIIDAMEERPQRLSRPPCDLSAVMRWEDYQDMKKREEKREREKERERLELLHAKQESAALTVKSLQQTSINSIIRQLTQNIKNRIEVLRSYPIHFNELILNQITRNKELLDEYNPIDQEQISKLNALEVDLLKVLSEQNEPQKADEAIEKEEKID